MKDRLPLGIGLSAVVLCALVCVGCGPKRPDLVPISGKITYQGKPVAVGKIMFHPEHGRPAIGSIGPDGSYRLTTFASGDGAVAGKHRVTVQAMRSSGGPKAKNIVEEIRGGMKDAPAVEWIVPEKYSRPDTSPLTAEVKPENNTIDFDIK